MFASAHRVVAKRTYRSLAFARVWFVCASALVAAAVANSLVESISGSGAFGGGYVDNDHRSVLPVLAIGAIFALAVLIAKTRAWIVAAARDLADRCVVGDLPRVVGLQLFVVFAMENAESFASGGGGVGGVRWLGGPLAFALLAHLTIGIATTFALGFALRALARLLATVVRSAFDVGAFLRARADDTTFFRRAIARVCEASPLADVRAIRGRAPPPGLISA